MDDRRCGSKRRLNAGEGFDELWFSNVAYEVD